MTLREIDGDPTRQLATDFARRGPWAALFARSGNNNTTTKGTDRDLTRQWAHGPANFNKRKQGTRRGNADLASGSKAHGEELQV